MNNEKTTHELIDRLAEELSPRWVRRCTDRSLMSYERVHAKIVVVVIAHEAHCAGLTWADIADYCGISVRTLERWRKDFARWSVGR